MAMTRNEEKERVEDLKKAMLRKFPALGTTASKLKYVMDDSLDTASTDGEYVYMNPEYLDELDDKGQLFIISHETLHVAFNHLPRLKNKHLETWNIATDAVINDMLRAEGLEIPKGLVDRPGSKDRSAEEVYVDLIKEREEKKRKSQMEGKGNSKKNHGNGEKQKDKEGEENQSGQGDKTGENGQNQQQQGENGNQPDEGEEQDGENTRSKGGKQGSSGNEVDEEFDDEYSEVAPKNHEIWKKAMKRLEKQNRKNKNKPDKDDKENEDEKDKQDDELNKEKENKQQKQGKKGNKGDKGKNEEKDEEQEDENQQEEDKEQKQNKSKNKNSKKGVQNSEDSEENEDEDEKGETNSNGFSAPNDYTKEHDNFEKKDERKADENSKNGSKEADYDKIKEENKEKEDEMSELEKHFLDENRKLRKELADKIRERINEQNKNSGNGAGGLVGSFGDLGEAKEVVSWKKLLRREFEKTEQQWSYRRANKSNYYSARLDDRDDYEKSVTEVIIDTSGSISDEKVRAFLRQVKHLAKDSKLKVGCFSDSFYGFTEIKSAKDIDRYVISGRGGTNIDSACVSFTKDKKVNKIIFTDGEDDGFPRYRYDKVKDNFLWLIYGRKRFTAPTGKIITVDLADMQECKLNEDLEDENEI